jgi:nicotinamide-nucleotide amidase
VTEPLLAAALIDSLRLRGLKLAVAESLTGGQIASAIVDVAGASDVFLGGVVAYATAAKTGMLGLSPALLETHGAVDAEVAAQMARTCAERFADSCGVSKDRVLGVSSTGVAGPASQDGKPAGTVFVAACIGENIQVLEFHFVGDRTQVRNQATTEALNLAGSLLSQL